MFITLKPRSGWKKCRTQAELTELLDHTLRDLPGQRLAYSQPIEMRINEMVSGVRADLAVKLFGDDFDVLAQEGRRDRGRPAVDPGRRRREHRADHRPADAADQDQPGPGRPLRRARQDGARFRGVDRQQAAGGRRRRATPLSARGPPARRITPQPRGDRLALGADRLGRADSPLAPGESRGRRRPVDDHPRMGPAADHRDGQRARPRPGQFRGRSPAENRRKGRAALGPLPRRVRRTIRESAAGTDPAADRRACRAGADLCPALLDVSQHGRRASRLHRHSVRLGGRHFRPVAARHAVFDLGGDRLHRHVGRGRARRHDSRVVRPPTSRRKASPSTMP